MNNIEIFSKEMSIKYTLIIILMFLGGLSTNPIKAQGSFSAKEQIKLLKIKNDLSKIERIASADNFWYYLGKCKSEKIYNKGVIDKDGNLVIKMEHRITVPIYNCSTFEFNSEEFTFDDNVFVSDDIDENRKAFVTYIKAKSKNIGHSTKMSKSK